MKPEDFKALFHQLSDEKKAGLVKGIARYVGDPFTDESVKLIRLDGTGKVEETIFITSEVCCITPSFNAATKLDAKLTQKELEDFEDLLERASSLPEIIIGYHDGFNIVDITSHYAGDDEICIAEASVHFVNHSSGKIDLESKILFPVVLDNLEGVSLVEMIRSVAQSIHYVEVAIYK